jgi:predicted amidohydrolase YtcJ
MATERTPAKMEAPGAAAQEAAAPATIFVAKRIVTMEPGQPEATAVAVADGTIVAVGSLAAVERALRGRPYRVDETFAGKVMLPGFIEHHVHPLLGALTMAVEIIAIEDWSVPGKFSAAALDEAAYRDRLRKAIAELTGTDRGETLFTWGYHQYFHGKIYRAQLDAIESERPIVIWHRSCHEFILNTAALKKYGITAPALQGHGLASEQASWEDGHFFEKGLEIVVPFIIKDMLAPKRAHAGTQIFKRYLLSKGITTICEPGTQLDRAIQSYWEEALNAEDACFRTYLVPDGRTLFEKYKDDRGSLIAQTQAFTKWGRGRVQWLPQQIKLFADGAIFSQLMQLREPYLDGHQGQWIAEPDDYAAAFGLYWDAGYRIHTHVNGDEGLQVVIDTLEERAAAHPRDDHRFTVVHFAVSTDEQVAALARLKATISANPYYVVSLADKYSEFGLGPERADSMVRLGSVAQTAMPIGLHSDMPMAPADPLFLAWCAANRTTVSGRTADPGQRIGVERAIAGITIEAAQFLSKEDELGSIKPGKKADFTILEQDPFAVPPSALKDIPVWGCVYEGRTFEAPATAPSAAGSHAFDLAPHAGDFTANAASRG